MFTKKWLNLCNFHENYHFLVEDEIQSYHWSKEYCTLHPLVVYFIDGDGNLQHNPLCFISDYNNHDTSFVYKIQTILVDYLKENLPIVDKIFCFSDGCAEQYKNHKNVINLCHHQQDFSTDTEWLFFATSHGKSPCDGVRRFVKHYVSKCSLQRPLHDQILNYQSMLDLCIREIPSITYMVQVRKKWSMFLLPLKIALQSQRPCLEQGVAAILYQCLATNCSQIHKWG